MTRKRRPTDVNQLARFLVDASTEGVGEPESSRARISDVMREMGRRGGRIGGVRRRDNMTAKARSKSASIAARARWAVKSKPAGKAKKSRKWTNKPTSKGKKKDAF